MGVTWRAEGQEQVISLALAAALKAPLLKGAEEGWSEARGAGGEGKLECMVRKGTLGGTKKGLRETLGMGGLKQVDA